MNKIYRTLKLYKIQLYYNIYSYFFIIQGAGAGGSGSSSILQLIAPLIGSSSVSTSLFCKSIIHYIICIYFCNNLENIIY
jgi:hypothetical protein